MVHNESTALDSVSESLAQGFSFISSANLLFHSHLHLPSSTKDKLFSSSTLMADYLMELRHSVEFAVHSNCFLRQA